MKKPKHEPIVLHLPEEISGIVRKGAFPQDPANPLVCFEFINGGESLFDTRKGIFLSPPSGVELPSRESLKAFGRLIASFREKMTHRVTGSLITGAEERPVEQFEVCC